MLTRVISPGCFLPTPGRAHRLQQTHWLLHCSRRFRYEHRSSALNVTVKPPRNRSNWEETWKVESASVYPAAKVGWNWKSGGLTYTATAGLLDPGRLITNPVDVHTSYAKSTASAGLNRVQQTTNGWSLRSTDSGIKNLTCKSKQIITGFRKSIRQTDTGWAANKKTCLRP